MRPSLHRRDGGLGQGSAFDEPLIGQEGLDDRVGAIAAGDHHAVRVGLLEQTLFLQIRDHALTRLEAVQAPVALRRRFVIGSCVDGEDI